MLRALINPSLFFPRSVVTVPFGVDAKTFGEPRLHIAVDRALPLTLEPRFGEFPVCNPATLIKTVLYPDDGTTLHGSMIRLVGASFEIRMLHFIPAELRPAALARLRSGTPLDRGDAIGPAGNKGLAVSNIGGSGRHVHYTLVLKPGVHDEELAARWPDWKKDETPQWGETYGAVIREELRRKNVQWGNAHVIARIDPHWGVLTYQVDSMGLLGL